MISLERIIFPGRFFAADKVGIATAARALKWLD
jgi:hypothetical protein